MDPLYRWVAASREGFIEQLVRYINCGHHLFVTGVIPEKKDVDAVDEKMLEKFGCRQRRWTRSRRKAAGIASVHYLRFERFWILIATEGQGPFFDEHLSSDQRKDHQFKSCRQRSSIKCFGYSIRQSYCERTSKLHTLVRLDAQTYRCLKAYFNELATKRSILGLEQEFSKLSFQPYRPVREQLFAILRSVNRRRKRAGYEQLDWKRCMKTRRRITKPFDEHTKS